MLFAVHQYESAIGVHLSPSSCSPLPLPSPPHPSCVVAWRIPWTEESGGLQFMGLQRVRREWVTYTFKKSRITKGEGRPWCNCKRSLSRSHSGLGNCDGPLELFQTGTKCLLGLFGCMLSQERIVILGKVASFNWGQFQKSNRVVNHEQSIPLS